MLARGEYIDNSTHEDQIYYILLWHTGINLSFELI